jgi:hypothetical protein
VNDQNMTLTETTYSSYSKGHKQLSIAESTLALKANRPVLYSYHTPDPWASY